MPTQNQTVSKSPHIPVLLQEVVEWSAVQAGSVVVDATVGFGGHARALLPLIGKNGRYIGIDKDERAVTATTHTFANDSRLLVCEGRFSEMVSIVRGQGVELVDMVLMDLGVSSVQLDDPAYGISFDSNQALDMRIGMNPGSKSAKDVVNQWTRHDLKELFTEHGQPGTNRLIDAIINSRNKQPIETVQELKALIADAVPKIDGVHPATRVFQALRVEANQEYKELRVGLEQAVDLLKSGGRLLVISFHSGEDRIVKKFMRYEARGCICPSEFPVCRCDHNAKLKLITKQPLSPSADEVKINPRARSARMRIAERI